MTTKQDMERQIASTIVDTALAANLQISVRNGGETDELTGSTNKEEILNEMFATDHDTLYFYEQSKPLDCIGWIMFVYGNDGFDVVADYSDNDVIHGLVSSADSLVNQFMGE